MGNENIFEFSTKLQSEVSNNQITHILKNYLKIEQKKFYDLTQLEKTQKLKSVDELINFHTITNCKDC